jgi:putative ABC transport system substrate-binding protein
MTLAADDALGQARLMAFGQGLAQLGWTVGRNVQIDIRWTAGKADDTRKSVTELVALTPDVILAAGGGGVGPLLQVTGTVPIVFTQVTDPVGAGFVESLGRPGGNATGFTNFEYGMSVKWLELLKEFAPQVTRVGILREPGSAGIGQWAIIQGVANSLDVELKPIGLPDAGEIERAVSAVLGGLVRRRSTPHASRIHRSRSDRYWNRSRQEHACLIGIIAGIPRQWPRRPGGLS